MDYWRAAVQTTLEHPLTGTGPGTFQRPYARLKAPDAEMARLVHNDFLEQFSDSGVPGGIAYLAWILAWILRSGRRVLTRADPFWFAVALGCNAWLFQGLTEFMLYVPALAWTAFLLIGATERAMETTAATTPHSTS
jgi:O-antigen ligase